MVVEHLAVAGGVDQHWLEVGALLSQSLNLVALETVWVGQRLIGEVVDQLWQVHILSQVSIRKDLLLFLRLFSLLFVLVLLDSLNLALISIGWVLIRVDEAVSNVLHVLRKWRIEV